jgi:hypothetical protein
MTAITQLVYDRWRSQAMVGAAKHALIVRLRPGRFYRNYETQVRIDNGQPIVPPLISHGHNQPCWQATWTPSGPWVELPNIESAKWTRDFTSHGVSTLTVVQDNVGFVDVEGVSGLYHTYARGYYSPTRGNSVNGRPVRWAPNEWENVLNGGYQIELWEGYGSGDEVVLLDEMVDNSYAPASGALARTWTGLVQTCEQDSNPDIVTLTARDFGLLFTDERLMGDNKPPEVLTPVHFADRKTGNLQSAGNTKGWILVQDVADIATALFIWAGFKEWIIHPFGFTLYTYLVYGEDSFYMDVITALLDQGNYTFYMLGPTNDDRSLGVPYFGPQTATNPAVAGMLDVRDADMTEALKVTWDVSDLPYVIRYRGAISPDGQTLGADLTLRVMSTYYPPWSGTPYVSLDPESFRSAGVGRVAGVLRHFSETLGTTTSVALNTVNECLFACVLAAIQYALGMATGQFQMPGLPDINLNEQINVVDSSTGTDSRMWLASIESDHVLGPSGSWHMTLGASLIDTEDLSILVDDYLYIQALVSEERSVAG